LIVILVAPIFYGICWLYAYAFGLFSGGNLDMFLYPPLPLVLSVGTVAMVVYGFFWLALDDGKPRREFKIGFWIMFGILGSPIILHWLPRYERTLAAGLDVLDEFRFWISYGILATAGGWFLVEYGFSFYRRHQANAKLEEDGTADATATVLD
jgi:hypothetical protein